MFSGLSILEDNTLGFRSTGVLVYPANESLIGQNARTAFQE